MNDTSAIHGTDTMNKKGETDEINANENADKMETMRRMRHDVEKRR